MSPKNIFFFCFCYVGHVSLGLKINKNTPNILLKTALKTMVQLGWILQPTWLYFGRFWVPSWCQVGTQIRWNPIQQPIKKMIRFWMPLRSIFHWFWPPTWGSSGGPSGVLWGSFWLLVPSWGQDASKTPPRASQTPPRPLQDTFLKDFWASWEEFFKDFGASWDYYYHSYE